MHNILKLLCIFTIFDIFFYKKFINIYRKSKKCTFFLKFCAFLYIFSTILHNNCAFFKNYYASKLIITPIIELIKEAIKNVIDSINPAIALPFPLIDFNPLALNIIPHIVTG